MTKSMPTRRAILIGVALALLIAITPNRGDFPSTADLIAVQQARLQGDDLKEWSLLSRFITRWPHNQRIWERMGLLDQRNGLCEQAIREFEMADRFGKLADNSFSPYAQCLLEAGQFQAVIDLLVPVTQHGNPPPGIAWILVKAYLRSGQGAQALEVTQHWTDQAPANSEAIYAHGLVLALTDSRSALSMIKTAADEDPAYTQAALVIQTAINKASLSDDKAYGLVEIGRAYGSLGEWVLAEYAFDQACQANPVFAEAHAWLGEARQHLGGTGANEFQKAISLDPDSITVQALNAIRFQRLGQVDGAISILKRIAGQEPNNPQWLISIGQAQATKGDLSSALDSFESAINLDPKNAEAWQALADFSFVNQYEVFSTGFDAVEQALLLLPEDAHSLDLVCQAAMFKEDLVSAKANCMEALRIDPNYAPAHYHLALILIRLDHPDQATRELEKAATLGSREAKSLLDQLEPDGQ